MVVQKTYVIEMSNDSSEKSAVGGVRASALKIRIYVYMFIRWKIQKDICRRPYVF